MKDFLEKHKTKLLIGAGVVSTVAAYISGNRRGVSRGYDYGVNQIFSAIYADHDATIGIIYNIVEKQVKPERIKDFVALGHETVKHLEKIQ